MISSNGCTWTDAQETLVMMDIFKNKYPGEELAEPICDFCKRVTEYIVEDASPMRPGLALVIGLMRPALFQHDGKFYIPVRHCFKCGAKYDGLVAGGGGLQRDITTMALTENERHEFFGIFNMGKFQKDQEIHGQSESPKQKKPRYLERE